ncbi:MAG: DUF4131 domain-containing protein, partial [Pseudomonadota bacterium]
MPATRPQRSTASYAEQMRNAVRLSPAFNAATRPLDALRTFLLAERARWILWSPILFGIGSAAYLCAPFEPSLALLAGLVALMIGLVAHQVTTLAKRQQPHIIRDVCLLVCLIASSGFVSAKLRSDWIAAPIVPDFASEVRVEGFVQLIEPRDSGGQRWTLRVTALADLAPDALPKRVRLTVTDRVLLKNSRRDGDGDRDVTAKRQIVTLEKSSTKLPGTSDTQEARSRKSSQLKTPKNTQFRAGDHIAIWGKVRPPPRPSAPGDFDFGRYAFFHQIGGVGYATRPAILLNSAEAARDQPWSVWFAAGIADFRATLGDRITAALPGTTGAIANALITGERGAIPEEINQAYRDAGLYHVLSIS